jgi:hypothetical protein
MAGVLSINRALIVFICQTLHTNAGQCLPFGLLPRQQFPYRLGPARKAAKPAKIQQSVLPSHPS